MPVGSRSCLIKGWCPVIADRGNGIVCQPSAAFGHPGFQNRRFWLATVAACGGLLLCGGCTSQSLSVDTIGAIPFDGVATGLAVSGDSKYIAAASRRHFSVVDRETGTAVFDYYTDGNAIIGPAVCWIDESNVLFSVAGSALCADVHGTPNVREVCRTRHYGITQISKFQDYIAIAGDFPGDFDVRSRVEIWRRKDAVFENVARLGTLKANALGMAIFDSPTCFTMATVYGDGTSATVARVDPARAWDYRVIATFPVDAYMVLAVGERGVFLRNRQRLFCFELLDSGEQVVEKWSIPLAEEAEGYDPISSVSHRALTVLEHGRVVAAVYDRMVIVNKAGEVVFQKQQMTGALCRLNREGVFLAAHRGQLVTYQIRE